MDPRRADLALGKSGAQLDYGELGAARGFDHVQIAVGIAGVEGFDRNGNEEVALPGVADAFSLGGMAGAIHFMHGVRHVIGERGFACDPGGIRLRGRRHRDQKGGGNCGGEGNISPHPSRKNKNAARVGHPGFPLSHCFSQNLRWIGQDTATIDAP